MSQLQIAIVDYQAGNVRSVQKALQRFDVRATITNKPIDIMNADAVVFPGQGASDSSMKNLKSKKLVEPIKDFISSGKPFLGVCLGMQLLLEASDEGVEPVLSILPGRTRRLPQGLKIPHMGWNQVKICSETPLLEGISDNSYFYFVHSYYADPEDKQVVVGTTTYGLEFCSVVAWENVIATQFHPEKSGNLGLKIYQNFTRLVEQSITID